MLDIIFLCWVKIKYYKLKNYCVHFLLWSYEKNELETQILQQK